MTPPTLPAQQEYIITRERAREISIRYNFSTLVEQMVDEVCSTPHTPTPTKSVSLTAIEIALRKEDCPSKNVQWTIEKLNQYQEQQEQHCPHTAPRPPCEECIYQSQSAEHDTTIAQTARDQALDEVKKYCLVRSSCCGTVKQLCYDAVISKIESLRTPTKEHP
jgi:hypothetical protein